MSFVTEIKTFAALGTGVIGSGWVARALAHGLDVIAWDPAPGAEAALRDAERDLFASYTVKPTAALCDRSAERPLKDKLVAGLWETTCPKGQCRVSPDYLVSSNYATKANPQPWWPASKDGLWGNNENLSNCSFSGGVPIGTFTGTPNVSGVARQPEYLIEWIDRGSDPVMRITARGFGADLNTEVVLQSYVRPPN